MDYIELQVGKNAVAYLFWNPRFASTDAIADATTVYVTSECQGDKNWAVSLWTWQQLNSSYMHFFWKKTAPCISDLTFEAPARSSNSKNIKRPLVLSHPLSLSHSIGVTWVWSPLRKQWTAGPLCRRVCHWARVWGPFLEICSFACDAERHRTCSQAQTTKVRARLA